MNHRLTTSSLILVAALVATSSFVSAAPEEPLFKYEPAFALSGVDDLGLQNAQVDECFPGSVLSEAELNLLAQCHERLVIQKGNPADQQSASLIVDHGIDTMPPAQEPDIEFSALRVAFRLSF